MMTNNTLTWIHPNDTFLTNDQQMNNAQIVANHFSGTDWKKESIAALCGNMAHESSLNPDMHELGYNDSPDRGYGLVQWTPMSKYTDWASANGLPWDSGDSQLARIDYEVNNNIQWIARSDFGNMTFTQFRTNSGGWSVDYLTEAFMRCYERPNWDAGTSSLPGRQSFANQCLTSLDWTGTGGGTSTPSSGHVQTVATPPHYQYEKTYTIKSGDTLGKIAANNNTTVAVLASRNHIQNVNKIYAGQTLAIPVQGKPTTTAAAQYYTVQRGDTLSKIGAIYHVSLAQLKSWNNIANINLIKIGQRLRVK
jgi:LysM repeat protein